MSVQESSTNAVFLAGSRAIGLQVCSSTLLGSGGLMPSAFSNNLRLQHTAVPVLAQFRTAFYEEKDPCSYVSPEDASRNLAIHYMSPELGLMRPRKL